MTSTPTMLTRTRELWRRAMQRRAVRWTLDVLLVVVIVSAVGAWQARHLPNGDPPRFSLRMLDGEAVVDNAALTGKPTLLVFWAPWCTVCRAESDNLQRVQQLVGDRARVLTVASDYRSLDEVRRFVGDDDYAVLLGGDRTAREFGVRAFPTAFFLDDEGRIDRASVGYTTTIGMLWRLLWA